MHVAWIQRLRDIRDCEGWGWKEWGFFWCYSNSKAGLETHTCSPLVDINEDFCLRFMLRNAPEEFIKNI